MSSNDNKRKLSEQSRKFALQHRVANYHHFQLHHAAAQKGPSLASYHSLCHGFNIMTRPIRIEFPNALYHVTARGDRREDVFDDDEDRVPFLDTLAQVIDRFNRICHAW